jgi:hypothetical protein
MPSAAPWLGKGALFNKSPDPHHPKLRNLGIAEAFVRIAAYMVMTASLPAAREKDLISDFDFGVAVPGGCEKFVKAAQAAASGGCTLVSCGSLQGCVRARRIADTCLWLQCLEETLPQIR